MAANNGGGRQGSQMNGEHVEFSVKAEEDLYLTGSENTIRRVTADTNYSCLMLKTQRFSSLFRHYAKYHGLRKDDLEYYFVNLLENDDTPESVQLQRGDTIMVRKRRKLEPPEVTADDDNFFKDMKELLDDEEHMDAILLIPSLPLTPASSSHAPPNEIRAHKSVLTARAEYFKAAFRTSAGITGDAVGPSVSGAPSSIGTVDKSSNRSSNFDTDIAFKESRECIIRVDTYFTEQQVRYALEFIYTNRIERVREISTDDLLSLLHLSDQWLLRDLKRLVEHELIRSHMSVSTIARMYGATEKFSAHRLSRACIDYIMKNLRQLAGNTSFEEEMRNYPHLCMPVLKAAADLIQIVPDVSNTNSSGPLHKKQRTEHHSSSAGGGANISSSAVRPDGTQSSSAGAGASNAAVGVGAVLRSPPVPDSDT